MSSRAGRAARLKGEAELKPLRGTALENFPTRLVCPWCLEEEPCPSRCTLVLERPELADFLMFDSTDGIAVLSPGAFAVHRRGHS